MNNKNYYKILGINQNATSSDIKKAYFKKAKIYHPDVCKDKDAEEKFKAINDAYRVLKEESSRQEYDEQLKNNKNYSSNHENQDNYNKMNSLFEIHDNSLFTFTNFITTNFISETEVIEAYRYFWLSFWVGGKGTIQMLKNKNASIIFKAFSQNIFIMEIKKSHLKQIRQDQASFKNLEFLKETINKITLSIPENQINSQVAFKWMMKVIDENNIFDEEGEIYSFLLMEEEIISLLTKFEQIFNSNNSINPQSHYSINNKIKKGGGTFLFFTIILILFLIFILR
ncbi:MAG: J domain-containing protein [Metamycoplasmataceae bacterium]